MKLILAIVVSCGEDGCIVKTIEDGEELTAAYSRLVEGRIQIRENQLVAVDLDRMPRELLWRWVRAQVDQVHERTVVLSDGRCQLIRASLPDGMELDLETGDEVWACSTGKAPEVHAKRADFDLAEAERLVGYIQPIIERHYAGE